MTQDHLRMRNFGRINKSTSSLTSILQTTSIRLLKDFGPQCITGKMYSPHRFRNHGSILSNIETLVNFVSFLSLYIYSSTILLIINFIQFTFHVFKRCIDYVHLVPFPSVFTTAKIKMISTVKILIARSFQF